MIKHSYLLFLILPLLSGCASDSALPTTIKPSSQPEAVITLTAPTVTAIMPSTMMPTVASTPTISVDILRYQCLEIADGLSSDQTLKGVVVFNNEDNTDAYLWNAETGSQTRLPREKGDRLLAFEVSPNRKRLLYQHSGKTNIQAIIVTADGQPIWIQSLSGTFSYSWFDDERLWYLMHPFEGTVLLNPFTMQKQVLDFDYPNYTLVIGSDPIKWRWHRGIPAYDPTLTRVIYPECPPSCTKETEQSVVLWDIPNRQILTRLTTTDFYGNTPVWSLDGQQFAIAFDAHPFTQDPDPQQDEFYLVSRDGEIRQLTHFADYFNYVEIYDSYDFSPDGHFIAFWMATQPNSYENGFSLAVLNTVTGDVTNYCVIGDPWKEKNLSSGPLWSPDGTQLLFNSRDLKDANIKRVTLVDIVNKYAAYISTDAELVGWMTTQP